MKMKTFLLLLSVQLFLITSCKKDKYTTEPQVKFKSISPGTVERGKIIQFITEFTDDEGDVDSIFIVQKWYSGNTVTYADTLKDNTYAQTKAPSSRFGEIIVNFEYLTNNSIYKPYPGFWTPSNRDTTATLGLVLKDKAGHRSNYAESDKIRLKRP